MSAIRRGKLSEGIVIGNLVTFPLLGSKNAVRIIPTGEKD